MKIPGKFILQPLVVRVLHCLHAQFSPPHQLFCDLDLLLVNLTSPVVVQQQ